MKDKNIIGTVNSFIPVDTGDPPYYEFRLKVNAEYLTWVSYDDFKKFLLTWFMPKIRQELEGMNIPLKKEKLGIVACSHENEDDGHCRDCNNSGWVTR